MEVLESDSDNMIVYFSFRGRGWAGEARYPWKRQENKMLVKKEKCGSLILEVRRCCAMFFYPCNHTFSLDCAHGEVGRATNRGTIKTRKSRYARLQIATL